ncbi:patatin-like phospholipase family protein [Ramlibacter sp. USB13]|uniref:Patatin-like phospholipase family protein n=1 Tax=Ramlibacter cellulosilyticus TaxID=2764187 RepID=A0A923MUY8_9BURK|nr:patatin-like phospholipase family protein [Ramlibacter cellulosilyticus]MBC5785506.1 patatin-like phospholipase family protein [Ramlibacter cellulosilyticus]
MRTINLALQGGGSHGAFTWGVLDALLEDGRIAFEGLSGTSAGAVNAVAFAGGWATGLAQGRDPREAAREKLAGIWYRVSALGSLGTLQQQFTRMLWGGLPPELSPGNFIGNAWRGLLSPYNSNPLDINPLRKMLEEEIDFGAVAAQKELKVFVSATHVNTGKAVVFTGRQLDARAVLASACLPMLFQAVEIDGQAYWDGGYSVNPALSPLIQECAAADVLLVQINPLTRNHTPRSSADILDRINELTFNASLLTQMRAIDFVNQLIADGAVSHARCKAVRVHRVEGGAALEAFPASSKTSADGVMINKLFDAGRIAAKEWLERHYEALGHRATVDIRRDYLDDTRMALPYPAHALPRSVGRGFRPWLQRLLGRG